MKRSELKEAIKSEIKSILSENLYGRGMAPEMADTVDALIQMLTPADTIESLLDNLTDDLNELPDEVDMDFFLNNIDAIEKEMYRNTRSIRFVKESTGIFGTSLRDLDQYPEEIEVGDIVKLTTGGDELEVIDSRQLFGSDMMAYRVKKVDGTKFNANVDFPEIGDETVEYSSDQLRLAEGNLNEDEDEDDKKAYKGAAKRDKKKSKRDKVIDAYNEIGGGKEVKEKAKKAKEGDKEALNWLKTNQPKIKAYNDLKK
tara:strand:- start:133 stop:903 length:771 start_codon:yes stop_codon:yes gene_type:complete